MVFSELKRFLLRAETGDSAVMMVANGIASICTMGFAHVQDGRFLPLLCELLANLNEFLTVKPDSVKLFAALPSGVICSLPLLGQNAGCEQYLVESIQFFAVNHRNHELERSDLVAIELAIERVTAAQPSTPLIHRFIHLIAGSPRSSVSPSFVIAQPLALESLVRVVLKSPILTEILGFLLSLVRFSFQNCVIATQFGFDAFLLDLVNEHNGDDFLSESVLDSIFKIVRHIGAVASRPSVVQKFIALMCPIDGQRVSSLELFYMSQMNKLLQQAVVGPVGWLASHAAMITVHDMDTHKLHRPYSILFWIYVDQPASQVPATIFEITDRSNLGLRVTVTAR
jgi:hypothetical protein